MAVDGGYSPPIADVDLPTPGTNDIVAFSGFQSSSPPLTLFSFSKKLNTGDKVADFQIKNGTMR